MVIGYFNEYRGYRGTIEHIPIHMLVLEPKEDESKISKDFRSRFRYYGRLLDCKNETIFYFSNDLVCLHKSFRTIVDNYIAVNEGIYPCEQDQSRCNYMCHCCCKNSKIDNHVQYEKIEDTKDFYEKIE